MNIKFFLKKDSKTPNISTLSEVVESLSDKIHIEPLIIYQSVYIKTLYCYTYKLLLNWKVKFDDSRYFHCAWWRAISHDHLCSL